METRGHLYIRQLRVETCRTLLWINAGVALALTFVSFFPYADVGSYTMPFASLLIVLVLTWQAKNALDQEHPMKAGAWLLSGEMLLLAVHIHILWQAIPLLSLLYGGLIIMSGLMFLPAGVFMGWFVSSVLMIGAVYLNEAFVVTDIFFLGQISLGFLFVALVTFFGLREWETAVVFYKQRDRKTTSRRDELFDMQQKLARAQADLEIANEQLEQRVINRTAALQQSQTQYRDLFEQTQANLKRTQALYEVVSLLNDFTDLKQMLQSAVNGIPKALPQTHVSLILLDVVKEVVSQYVVTHNNPYGSTAIPYDELQRGLTGWVLRNGRPAVSPKNYIDPREAPDVQERRTRSGAGSIIVVPLKYGRSIPFGTLTAIRPLDAPDFREEDIDWMVAIGEQVAAAIHAAQTTIAYSRFVPQEFLYHLDKANIIDVRLGDQVERQMTILFADIRDFTGLSELMTPKQSFDFVNRFLGAVGPLIRAHNGFVDKYTGDGLMALFPESATDAVDAGLQMLAQLNAYNAAQGETAVRIGIGIHTGHLMLGTIGEAERMETTVISDAVNIASRLETLTKTYLVPLIVSEDVIKMTNGRYAPQHLGQTHVKGRHEPINIYSIPTA